MKILLATGLYPPEIGGPATYAAMLETHLPQKGVAVSVVPFGMVRHFKRGVRHFEYLKLLWKESKGVDVIYALDPVSVGLPAAIVARLRRKPFLIRLGGDYAWEQGRIRFGLTQSLDEYLADKQGVSMYVRLFSVVQTLVCKQARTIVVPSQYLKSVVERWGIASSHITVIYSALFPLVVEGTKDELRRQLEFTGPTIVSAARLVPWKGFKALLNVVALLRTDYPDIMLVIIGDGEERASHEAEARRLGVTEQVRFTGRLSKEALGAAIKAADIFALNTAYEGLSHQLIEVMDLGTPIVTTTAGGNPELITNGVQGFLVPFDDVPGFVESIKRLLNHPETYRLVVQSARGRSKDFSEGNVIEAVYQLLQTLKR